MKKTMNTLRQAMTTAMIMGLTMTMASANDIADSTIGTGLKELVGDVSTFLVVLCPLVAAACITYFLIRKGMADEQDGKRWQNRAVMAGICGVAGMLASAFVNLLSGYFL